MYVSTYLHRTLFLKRIIEAHEGTCAVSGRLNNRLHCCQDIEDLVGVCLQVSVLESMGMCLIAALVLSSNLSISEQGTKQI